MTCGNPCERAQMRVQIWPPLAASSVTVTTIGTPVSAPLPELDEKAPTLPEEIAEPQPDPELDSEAVGQTPGEKLEGEPAVSTPVEDEP